MQDVKAAQPQTQELPTAATEASAELPRISYRKLAAELKSVVDSYLPNPSLPLVPTLHFAAFNGSLSKLSHIKSPALLESKDAKGLTPLHYAIAARQTETVQHLIDKLDLSYLAPDGNSYLHFAALSADPEILDLFLNKDLDPAHRNREHLTAAHLWTIVSNDPQGLEKLAYPGTKDDEPLPFTPFELMALKTADAENLLSDSEWELFTMNLADLAVVGFWSLLSAYKIDNYFSSFVSYVHTGITLAKTGPISQLAADSPILAANTGTKSFLEARVIGWLTGSKPLCNFAQSSACTVAVAQHTLTSIPNMKNASWTNILTASGVRFLNTACAALDTYLLVDPLEVLLNKRLPWTINRMSATERLTDPVLTSGLADTGETAIKYPYNYKRIIDPAKITETCDDFTPYYKKFARVLHPDKNPGNNTAAAAMTNLGLLKAYFCSNATKA